MEQRIEGTSGLGSGCFRLGQIRDVTNVILISLLMTLLDFGGELHNSSVRNRYVEELIENKGDLDYG